MANKKLQNSQNKKSNEGAVMNGNTVPVAQSQSSQSTTAINSAPNNNNSQNSNVATSSSSTGNATNSNSQPTHHQRLSSTSSTSQQTSSSKQPFKKLNEVEKTTGQTNQGNFRGGGKDHRAREKEKENSFRSYQSSGGRQNNQATHHHQNSGQNQQNNRKKDNKFQNRDHSSQSHRSGGYSHGSHHHQENNSKVGLASNSSSTSSVTQIALAPAPAPAPVSVSTSTGPIAQESKTVQTEPQEESKKKKEKVNVTKEPEQSPFKSADPKDMDTVMAFQEHDDWSKVEMMCELTSFMTPPDLKLLHNCIEGSLRCYTNQMRPVEQTSNSVDPTACLPSFVCSPPSFNPAQHQHFQQDMHNRFMAGTMFCHTPVLPSLIATVQPIIYANDAGYHPSSSTTPSSSISAPTKEMTSSGTTPTSSTKSGSNTPPDGAQDPPATTAKGTTPVSAVTPEPSNSLGSSTSPAPIAVNQPPPSTPAPPTNQPNGSVLSPDPEVFLKKVLDITSYLYILISTCQSTNRKSAAKLSDYMSNVILREKDPILSKIPDTLDRVKVLVDIGKIVAALVHHPAVSVDDKMKFGALRDGLRAEIDALYRDYYSTQNESQRKQTFVPSTHGVGDLDDDEEESEEEEEIEQRFEHAHRPRLVSDSHPHSSSAPGTFFITRFIGRPDEKDENLFRLEIHWSDGDCTFTQRSREQLRAFQHRLLDEFGQQRSEKYHPGMSSSLSSFDEENKKLSTSTSTMEMRSACPSGERIVPRLAREATSAQYIQYINELSDLPARMMLSAVICEEFNGTRARTEDLFQEYRDSSDGLIFSRWKNPRTKTPVRYFLRNAAGSIEPVTLPVTLPPFLYSNVPPTHVQSMFPSCSNCGGAHVLKHCEKPTLLDKKASMESKLRGGDADNAPIPTSSANNAYNQQQQYAQNMYAENQHLMAANHMHHHQHQQMIQSNMYSGNYHRIVYDPNTIVFPQLVPPAQNSAANGANGNGNHSNNNF